MSKFIDTDFEYLEHYHQHGGTYELPVEIVTSLECDIEDIDKKYVQALKLLLDFNLPCEFIGDDEVYAFMDIHSDWCETHCSDDDQAYLECWDKYLEWKVRCDTDATS